MSVVSKKYLSQLQPFWIHISPHVPPKDMSLYAANGQSCYSAAPPYPHPPARWRVVLSCARSLAVDGDIKDGQWKKSLAVVTHSCHAGSFSLTHIHQQIQKVYSEVMEIVNIANTSHDT
jgi:hypothetical protein